VGVFAKTFSFLQLQMPVALEITSRTAELGTVSRELQRLRLSEYF
jgi:hypothetical protein